MSKLKFRDATDQDVLASQVQTGELTFRDVTDNEIVDLDSDLPDPFDDTPTRNLFGKPSVFSATKFLTKPTRSIIQPLGQGAASRALRDAGAGNVTQALLGLPIDAAQNLLGVVGTGVMATGSIPAEIAGLLGANAMEKRRIARGLGGMVEAQPFTPARGYASLRAQQQQPTKTIAREAQDIGVTPPAKTLGPTTAGIVGTLEELPIVKGTLLDEAERVASETADVAARAAPRPQRTTYEAGEKLKKGVESFGERTQKRQDQLLKRVDELKPPETNFEAANTVSFLNEIMESWSGFKSAA